MPGAGFELPPGATFEPDPQSSLNAMAQENKHAPN
jgi:putative (di)nucleoside polyphosphate hydrolase